LALILAILCVLTCAHWTLRDLFIQVVCGLCIAILLIDGFFFSQSTVPFNQPRMPGKTNFPLMLTLYIGVFPMFVYAAVQAELAMEKRLSRVLLTMFITAAIHLAVAHLRKVTAEVEEEMEGYEGEFQLLGLS
jgi:glucose uptake protein GlcU